MGHDPRRQTTRPTTVTRGGQRVKVASPKPRTGFFDSFETVKKRVAREQLFKKSATRQTTFNIFRQVREAGVRAKARKAQEARTRAVEDRGLARAQRTPGLIDFGTRMAQNITRLREKREENEALQQKSDIATATERFRGHEQANQPLTLKGAQDLLSPKKKVAQRRLGQQFRRQAAREDRFVDVTPAKNNIEALDRMALTPKQRTTVLEEISRRGDADVSILDVFRF